MKNDDVLKAVTEVQKAAECTHAASAVMGVQQIIEDRAKDRYHNAIEQLSGIMKFAMSGIVDLNTKNVLIDTTRKQLAEVNDSYKKDYSAMEPKLYFAYSDFKSNAGRTISDKLVSEDKPRAFTIVLQQSDQQILDHSRVNGLIQWTTDTKEAKKRLQRKTLHELAHTILPVFKSNGDGDVTEDNAKSFQKELCDCRKVRNFELYKNLV